MEKIACPECGHNFNMFEESPPTMTMKNTQMLDITAPEHGVQVEVRTDGKVLWVHVDGITVLRICQMPRLDIEDARQSTPTSDLSEIDEEMRKVDDIFGCPPRHYKSKL